MSEPIEVLPGLTAIRRRATMYVGPLEDPLLPNTLLREALCCARDDALLGCCSRATVVVRQDGWCRVSDDGPGWPTELHPGGLRTAERFLQELHACAAHKTTEQVAQSTCTNGIVVLNALSRTLSLRIYRDGQEWTQDYVEGIPTARLAVVGQTDRRGTDLTFHLDDKILPVREFDLDEFALWVGANVMGLEVVLVDERQDRPSDSIR